MSIKVHVSLNKSRKKYLKIHMESQKSPDSHNNLEQKKEQCRKDYRSRRKLYYTVTVMKAHRPMKQN